MKIRICKGYKNFFVERLDDRNEWRYWLPKDDVPWFKTPRESLDAAREERERELLLDCEKMGAEGHVETEI